MQIEKNKNSTNKDQEVLLEKEKKKTSSEEDHEVPQGDLLIITQGLIIFYFIYMSLYMWDMETMRRRHDYAFDY